MTDTKPAKSQEMIRQWAKENGFFVGQRGPLSPFIVLAYQQEMGQTPDDSPLLVHQAQPAAQTIPSLDPLADYLEPRFGDIYAQYEKLRDHWTPELKHAVTHYLLHKVTDADFEAISLYHLFYMPTGNTRAEKVQSVIERESVFDIAYALHSVAVENAPSLDLLLEQEASRIDLKIDCAKWLRKNVTYDQLVSIARISGLLRNLPLPEVYPADADSDGDFEARAELTEFLVDQLSPQPLADAWNYVTSAADTDLTDEEWSLLEPLLPMWGKARLVSSTTRRQVINGLLYLSAHPERRLRLPLVYQRNYRLGGVFARMLAGLEGNPEAERIVAWLRIELEGPRWRQEEAHD